MGKAVRNGRLVVLPPTSWSHVSNRAPLRLDAWPIQGAQKYRPSTNNRLVSTDVALSFTGLHIHRSLAPSISINLRNSSVLSRMSFFNGTGISYKFRTAFDHPGFDEWYSGCLFILTESTTRKKRKKLHSQAGNKRPSPEKIESMGVAQRVRLW